MKKSKKARAAKKPAVRRARKAAAAKPVPMFYKQSKVRSPSAGDSLSEAFATATRSADAIAGLRQFLKKYEPPDREYQDGFHRSRVRAAQYELMRLEYITGNVKAGDKLLAELQDLDR